MKLRILMFIVLLIILILVIRYVSVDDLISFIENIRTNPFLPVVYVSIYALAVTLFLPATPFTLIAPVLFGFWYGLFLVVIAANLGCHIGYHIARILGKDFVLKRVKSGSFIEKATTFSKDNSFLFMMYARLIPVFPFALVNLVSGFLDIKYKTYSIATLIGMLPGSIVYVYFGYSVINIQDNPLGLIISFIVLIVFTILVSVLSKVINFNKNE